MLDNIANQIPQELNQLSGTPDSGQVAQDAMLTEQQPAAEQPITREEIAALLDQKLNEYKTKQYSAQQKAESRIKKEFQAQIESLGRAGVQLNPEQAKALQDETRQRISAEEGGETPGGRNEPQGDAKQAPQSVQTVNAMAAELAKEYGFGLDEKTDPEVKTIVFDTPVKYLRSLENALKAKQERLAGQKNQREAKPGARTPMIAGGATPGNPIANTLDLDTLYSMATKRR